jgi:hypothetical protein
VVEAIVAPVVVETPVEEAAPVVEETVTEVPAETVVEEPAIVEEPVVTPAEETPAVSGGAI